MVRPAPADDGPTRIAKAERLWQRGQPIGGADGEQYLKSRSLVLDTSPHAVRFLPRMSHHLSPVDHPAIVVALRDAGGEFRGVQWTYIARDGSGKAGLDPVRKTLGMWAGNSVHLAKPGDELGLAEGLETGWSAQQMFGVPVWCCLGGGNLKQVIIPPHVRRITIYADNGEVGHRFAKEAAALAHYDGCRVAISYPPENFGDFNDALKAGRTGG